MTRCFCDWCGRELEGDWPDNPFVKNGEICVGCWTLAKETFNGRYVVEVEVVLVDGSQYRHTRPAGFK